MPNRTDVPRYAPSESFPPYSYVSGMHPHPVRDPQGHSYGCHTKPMHLKAEDGVDWNRFRYAIDLFNHGYYWEAHEAWEELWHAAGRCGAWADLLKGYIHLAAAGVKMREGRGNGVRRHALRTCELIAQSRQANAAENVWQQMIELNELEQFARSVSRMEPSPDDTTVQTVKVVFAQPLRLLSP
ncbi:MAG: DUF309 domain-containing protein [Planctomycetota bacterium]|nr:DUF309 domain-containing protein [Planctomycetota bacterium]